jgi:ubiquinone/menaquinone biosynthesis C-methylase UbiE
VSGESSSATQTLDQLKAEIEFRSKLAIQHVSGQVVLPDYYQKAEHDKILLQRVDATQQRMHALTEQGVMLSPFLELGAERGQRSLVLANDFGAAGAAADVSYDQLATMTHFSRLFEKPVLPLRVCCDAKQLPFRSNSIPFIFCYQFLHHFPRIAPVVKEIHRVLGDGYFYFDEEPFKRTMKLLLYRQRDKIYSESTLRKHRYVRLIESFISESMSDEEEHGVVENHDISLAEWIDALGVFSERDLHLVSIYNVRSRLTDRAHVRNLPNFLLGGIISGLCRKKTSVRSCSGTDVAECLACPDCTISAPDGSFDRPALVPLAKSFKCTHCGFAYPRQGDVLFLLPRAELEPLYPHLGLNAG